MSRLGCLTEGMPKIDTSLQEESPSEKQQLGKEEESSGWWDTMEAFLQLAQKSARGGGIWRHDFPLCFFFLVNQSSYWYYLVCDEGTHPRVSDPPFVLPLYYFLSINLWRAGRYISLHDLWIHSSFRGAIVPSLGPHMSQVRKRAIRRRLEMGHVRYCIVGNRVHEI